MKFSDLNHYGCRKAVYDDCLDLIRETNHRHIEVLNLWFMFITAVCLVLSLQNTLGMSSVNAPLFIGLFVIGAVFQAMLTWADRLLRKHMVLATYFNILCLLAFGIVSSISRPYMAATVNLVVLVIVALSYVDRFFRMFMALIFSCGVFISSSYLVKPGSIFLQDLFNVSVVFLLSLSLHYTFQSARMRQFINFRESTRIKHRLMVSASFDALTGLLNRDSFFAMAEEVMKQEKSGLLVFGIMDLDGFGEMNDSLGHQMGDKLIQMTGQVIAESLGTDRGDRWTFPERAVREGIDFAGRLGGDEFGVILRNLPSAEEASASFDGMIKKLNEIRTEGVEGIRVSAGVAVIGKSDTDIDRVYSRADAALQSSKGSGGNCITLTGEV